MKTHITNNIKAIILALVLTLGVGYAVAGNFTSPNCAPPGCNADAPLNVGSGSQGKAGTLAVGTTDTSILGLANLALKVNGTILSNGAAFNGPIAITDGTQATGRILVSSDTGFATWKDPATIPAIQAGSSPKQYIINNIYAFGAINYPQGALPKVPYYDFAGNNVNPTVISGNDLFADASIGGTAFYSDNDTRQQLCKLMFPNAPYNTTYSAGNFNSPDDNTVFVYNSGFKKWIRYYGYIKNHLNGNFTCTSIETITY